ncbi:MAG: Ig-like domain-containing protein, partial [Clostridia bacterium]|nr:Ig-like domain-containing protein [Clostridia bacterium]
MKTKNKRKLIIMLACALVLIGALLTVTVLAANETGNAMTDINASFSENQIGTTVTVTDNQYLNGAVEMTTYYSGTSPAVVGYNGTPLILYVVNTGIERIGVKTDVEIISSMLERGYVVSVLDYKNNARAVAPTLDWSVQLVRRDIFKGAYFGASSLVPKGNYENNYVVPAGYDVSIGNVFWEADKHGADGTLEKIVENWNTDFRGCFRNTVILWVNSDGVQKSTQVGFDGSAPQWYSDAAGTTKVDATDANAKYIKVQHTLATDITDCVGKNGEFIDIDLHMDIVYPTVKDGATLNVPIGVLANSSEYLCSASRGSDLRALHNGFLFRGYAAASFDYLWQPMAHADYYNYYDGRTELGALTGDRMNYGLQLYNDKRINTAAMRYLRYLALTEPETYSFDISSIGVFGNSKGGWFTFLGEEVLTENTAPVAGKTLAEAIDARLGTYIPKRIFEGHSNESRYDAKRESYVKNGIAIDGGELQPWLTYTDEDGNECEILSYASWIYASNGAQDEDITAGHAPVFAALHLRDDFSTYQNAFGEVTGCLNDIPSMYVVVDLGHTFAYGPDWFRGFDTYDAMFAFASYYLKDSAVEVIYTTPSTKTGLIGTTSDITVKFSGAVPESEIEKITLTASDGTVISGAWSAVRGNTEWTFSHEALSGDTEYTLTVPETLAGDNGKAMGKSFTASFRTEPEDSETVETVTTDIGTYFIVSKPAVLGADARIRFYASGAAANTASLYAVSGFDKSSPDSATVGSLIGSVNLFGEGYYEIDVTEALSGKSGECVFLLKAARAVGEVSKTAKVCAATIGAYARHNGEVTAPDGKAGYGMYINENINASGTQQYLYEVFYANTTTLFTANNLFGNTNITEADLGRRYTFSIDVYDTVERVIQLRLNSVATAENGLKDLDRVYYNFKTKAGEWTTLSFEYTVYEPSYGAEGFPRKTLYVLLGTDGAKESPIYLSDMTVTETTTPIQVSGSATLVMGSRADSFKESSAAAPFAIGSTSYNTLAAALAAAKSGETIAMTRSYTTTDGEVLTAWEKLASVTLDLGGYSLYTGKTSLIGAKATSLSVPRTEITVKGGTVYLDTAPLVSYTGSSAGGDGKVFDIKLTDVDILNTRSSALREVISASTIETTSGATVNFTLTNTDIRLNTEYNTFCPINVFPSGDAALNVGYKLYGGTVFTDTLYNLKLWDSPKSVEMLEYNGAYTTVSVPECFSLSSLSVMTDNGIASFEAAGSEGYVTSYAPKTSELSTKYGLIPEAYASVEDWPFVLFDEKGNFLGAYNAFIGVGSDGHGAGGVLSPAKNYVNNAYDGYSYATEKEAFILLRRNYTFDSSRDAKFDNLAQTQGTINIDLNGYSISAGNVAYPIIPAFSKGHSLATGNKIFPTTIKVKNGGLYQYKSGTVAMSVWDSIGDGSIANKDFNLIFDNVTFGFVEGADTVGLIAHGWDANKATKNAAPFNFTYNDCKFDLRTTMNKFGTANIFSLATAASKYIKLDITVNGGKILVSDPSKITVVATTTSDTYGSAITFGVGSDGKHVSYYAPSTTSVPVGKYIGKDGNILGFLKSGSDGDDGIWTLNDNPLVSEYGTITETYKDEQQYPFALFTTNGTFVGGYATMKAAFDKAKGDQASNVYDASKGSYGASEKSHVILLRRDYTTSTSDNWDNWAQIKGTVTLDLNGHTVTQGSGTSAIFYLVDNKGWGGAIFPSTINVKNGDLNVLTSVIEARIWATVANGAMANKFFTWNYDNVDFGFAPGATSTSMLAIYRDERNAGYPADIAAPFIFNYTECDFDLVTNAPTSGAKLFNAAPHEKAWLKVTMTVKGGTITAPSLTVGKLFAVETVYGSSVTFVKGDSGYTELYIKDGGTAPTGTDIPTDGGNYRYVKTGTADGYVLYTLSNLTTKYGTIPEAYASIADYPFIVFDNSGNFIAAATALYGQNQSGSAAIAKAMYAVLNNNSYKDGKWADGAKTAIILMRRDYTLYSYEYQDNLAQAQGEIIIDLNGYTLSESVTRTGTAA